MVEYVVKDGMPDGAVIHVQMKGDVACVHLNSSCPEFWAHATVRAGLDMPRWVLERSVQANRLTA